MANDAGSIRGILLDLDGVLWRGNEPMNQAADSVRRFKEMGLKVRFVSNNSGSGLRKMIDRFHRLGIPADPNEIVLATQQLAKRLAKKQARATVYLIGSDGFKEDLEQHGLRVIEDPEEIDYLTDFVVVGSDQNISFEKLTQALRCLQKGAGLAAANQDLTYPIEGGLLLPGAGTLVAAVSAMAGREPEIMVGKPNPDLLLVAMENMGLSPNDCVMVGDTVETDIKAAHAAQMRSILVLTGNTSEADAKKADPAPWKVVPSIAEVVSAVQ